MNLRELLEENAAPTWERFFLELILAIITGGIALVSIEHPTKPADFVCYFVFGLTAMVLLGCAFADMAILMPRKRKEAADGSQKVVG